jgi:hypothetical protein
LKSQAILTESGSCRVSRGVGIAEVDRQSGGLGDFVCSARAQHGMPLIQTMMASTVPPTT